MSGTQEPQQNQNSAPVVNQNTGKPKKKKLTQERLKELLHYDPETGVFTRIATVGNQVKVGDVAGCKNTPGYMVIRVDDRLYSSHRLAWLYVHGYFPENQIDHINRVRTDNRLCNLREVNQSCNNKNSSISVKNTTGVVGVEFGKQQNKWIARITLHKTLIKSSYVGIFSDFTEAVAHRLAAEQCLDWATCNNKTTAAKYMERYLDSKKD